MNKTPLHIADVLQTAGDLVSEVGWTKVAIAKTDDGRHVQATHKDATCFCALGAIRKARSLAGRKYSESDIAKPFFEELPMRAKSIPSWNDNRARTVEDVREAFYSAAERIREQHAC